MNEQQALAKMVAPGTKRRTQEHPRVSGKRGKILLTEADISRFESKYTINEESGCWEWQRGIFQSTGYGQFCLNSRSECAHRVSYTAYVGEIPFGVLVLHKCDNPLCINPEHLFLGTDLDNNRDMISKGRANYPSGEDSGNCVLTKKQVRYIRKMYAPRHPEYGGAALARFFGVSQQQISKIILNVRWKKDNERAAGFGQDDSSRSKKAR
jgi:hypothetical protein